VVRHTLARQHGQKINGWSIGQGYYRGVRGVRHLLPSRNPYPCGLLGYSKDYGYWQRTARSGTGGGAFLFNASSSFPMCLLPLSSSHSAHFSQPTQHSLIIEYATLHGARPGLVPTQVPINATTTLGRVAARRSTHMLTSFLQRHIPFHLSIFVVLYERITVRHLGTC